MYFSVVLTCLFQLGWMGSRKQSTQICGYQFAKTARASKGQSVSLFWEILTFLDMEWAEFDHCWHLPLLLVKLKLDFK